MEQKFSLRFFGMILAASFLLIFIGAGAAWIVTKKDQHVSPVSEKTSSPSSSIAIVQKKKSTTDQYPPSQYFPRSLMPTFPDAEVEIKKATPLDPRGITAIAWAAMDRETGQLLVGKNLTAKRPLASVTKAMTALIAQENAPLTKMLAVSDTATKAGEAVMGLTSGERITVEDLLYGIILPSGNDAAETLAEGIFLKRDQGGSSEEESRQKARATFIASMNKKATEIGMNDTFFINPTGLDGETIEESSYSTPLDLLGLGNYFLRNSSLSTIASTQEMVIPYKEHYHKAFFLYNILQFKRAYPGILGIKPGITDFAGETLLSYAENGGKKIILVLLGSTATKDDAVKIYDYIFKKLGVTVSYQNK